MKFRNGFYVIVFSIILISLVSFNVAYSQLVGKQEYYEMFNYSEYDLDKIEIQIIGQILEIDETSNWIKIKLIITNNDIVNYFAFTDYIGITDNKGRTYNADASSYLERTADIDLGYLCNMILSVKPGFTEEQSLCFEVPKDFVFSSNPDTWDFEVNFYDYSSNWCTKNDECQSKSFKYEPQSTIEKSDNEIQKIPEWVKNIFIWYANGEIGEDDLLGAIRFLVNEGIIKLD